MLCAADLSASAADENSDTAFLLRQPSLKLQALGTSHQQPPMSAKKRALGDATSRLNAAAEGSPWASAVTPQKRGGHPRAHPPPLPFGLVGTGSAMQCSTPGKPRPSAAPTPMRAQQPGADADWEARALREEVEARRHPYAQRCVTRLNSLLHSLMCIGAWTSAIRLAACAEMMFLSVRAEPQG